MISWYELHWNPPLSPSRPREGLGCRFCCCHHSKSEQATREGESFLSQAVRTIRTKVARGLSEEGQVLISLGNTLTAFVAVALRSWRTKWENVQAKWSEHLQPFPLVRRPVMTPKRGGEGTKLRICRCVNPVNPLFSDNARTTSPPSPSSSFH